MSLKRLQGSTPGLGSTPPEDVPSVLDDLTDVDTTTTAPVDGDNLSYAVGSAVDEGPVASAASTENGIHVKEHAYDVDNSGTYWWTTGSASDNWIWFDLGSAKTIGKITTYMLDGDRPSTMNIEYSSNATDWFAATAYVTVAGGTEDWEFTPISARYWRLDGRTGSNWWRLYGVDLYSYASTWVPATQTHALDDLTDVDLSGLADKDILQYDVGATEAGAHNSVVGYHTDGSHLASNAVDGDDGTYWRSYNNWGEVVGNIYVGWASAITINRIILNNSGGYATTVNVYSSDNGTDWTLIDEFTGLGSGINNLDFTTTEAKFFKIAEDGGVGTWWQVYELEFWNMDSNWLPATAPTTVDPDAHITTVSTTEPTSPDGGDVWVDPSAAAGSVAIPAWMSHLADRTIDGEAVHADDQEFTGTIGGTAVTPSGTAVWTQGKSLLSAAFDDQSAADVAVRLYPLTPASAPVTIEASLKVVGADVNYSMCGIVFTDGVTTGSNASCILHYHNSSDRVTADGYHGTIDNMATGVGSGLPNIGQNSHDPRMYLRLVWTGTNTFDLSVSYDGVSWMSGVGWSDTLTPTHFGVLVSTWGGSSPGVATFEYLRVTESDLSV